MAKACATTFPGRMREMRGGYEATQPLRDTPCVLAPMKPARAKATVRQAFSVFDDTGIHPNSIVESREPRMIAPSGGSELRKGQTLAPVKRG